MSLTKYYYVTDKVISKVPPAHGLDNLTRLQMKLDRLDQVMMVCPPNADDFHIDKAEGDFIWRFLVKRRIEVPWSEVDAAVAKALSEFLKACAVS